MRILAIDTSGQQAGAAIFDSYIGVLVGEVSFNARTGEKSWTHSEILMPAIDQLFQLSGTDMQNIDYVAYTNGPGSFTGLRIGASTALGLASGLGRPSIPVPTLDALAYNMLGMANGGVIVPMMDARRGQVYSAIYRIGENGTIARETEYLASSVEDILKMVESERDVFFLGDGTCAYKESIVTTLPHATFLPPNNNRQRASSVALCAINQITTGFTPTDKVEILYIRAPQAIQDLANRASKST